MDDMFKTSSLGSNCFVFIHWQRVIWSSFLLIFKRAWIVPMNVHVHKCVNPLDRDATVKGDEGWM